MIPRIHAGGFLQGPKQFIPNTHLEEFAWVWGKVSMMVSGSQKLRIDQLGPPVVPFYPFLGEVLDNRKKGTLILTSLLEDLANLL